MGLRTRRRKENARQETIDQSIGFRLAINKKTLEALGLTIPGAMLMRTDEVVD